MFGLQVVKILQHLSTQQWMMLLHDPTAETFLSALVNYRLDLRLLRLKILSSLFFPSPLLYYISGSLRHSLYSLLNKSFHLYTTTCTQHT